MIPLFPDFHKLSLDYQFEIQSFVKQFPPYSDFNFVSLWSYNTEDDLQVSYLNGNLVIKMRDYITNEPIFTFLGNNQVTKTAGTLIKFSEEQLKTPELKLIPESIILSEKSIHEHFDVQEDQDNFDYVLSAVELSTLAGSKHHGKANLARQFHKLYPEHTSLLIDMKDPQVHEQLVELFYEWEKGKGRKREDTEHELVALKRLYQNADSFNIFGVGIYHNQKLISFIISEVVHNEYAVAHFLKTNPQYKGITEATHKVNSQYLVEKGVKHINFEQDLGLPGLRQGKQQWHPTHYLKKYKIRKK